jgi:hypothetical protein
MPSGAELVANDQRTIVNNAHVLVWTDTKNDRRVMVVAEIPSGVRSKHVEAYIESTANCGELVLKIKTCNEWMDPNLLLTGDRVEENVPFYDESHGLITAFH